MKVITVELTDMADSDSKEEQDTVTAVDNICYERVPSKLMYCITYPHLCELPFLNNITKG